MILLFHLADNSNNDNKNTLERDQYTGGSGNGSGYRELFSLVTSAIYVRIKGHRSEDMRIVYHMAQVFVYCCVLTTVDS